MGILLHPDYMEQCDQRRGFMTTDQKDLEDGMLGATVATQSWLPKPLGGGEGATIQEHLIAETPDVIQEAAAFGFENVLMIY